MEKKIKVSYDGKETKEQKDKFIQILANAIYEYLKKEQLLVSESDKKDTSYISGDST